MNFSVLRAELAQSFPSDLAGISAQKLEKLAEIAGISAQTVGIPLESRIKI